MEISKDLLGLRPSYYLVVCVSFWVLLSHFHLRTGGKGSILVMSISQFFGSVMSISQFFGSVIIMSIYLIIMSISNFSNLGGQ